MVAREEGRGGRARVVIKMVLEKGLGGVLAEKAKGRVGGGSSKGAASSERSQLGKLRSSVCSSLTGFAMAQPHRRWFVS